MFLNLHIRKSRIRANGALVHEAAAGDKLGPSSNRNLRVEKPAIRSQMSHSQLRTLARAAGRRILVTFTARLGVVQRPEPIRYTLHLVKLTLIGLVSWLIDHTVALAVEACRRFGRRWAYRTLFSRAPILSQCECP